MKRNVEKRGNRMLVLRYAAELFVWGGGDGTLTLVGVFRLYLFKQGGVKYTQ